MEFSCLLNTCNSSKFDQIFTDPFKKCVDKVSRLLAVSRTLDQNSIPENLFVELSKDQQLKNKFLIAFQTVHHIWDASPLISIASR